MEEKTTLLEPLIERAEAYGKTSYELFKLQALEKTTGVVSTSVSRGLAFFVLALFVVFVSTGVSIWLGDLLGKAYYGFLCVAAFYGILGIVLYFFFHDRIKTSVSNSFISQMLN